MSDARAGMFRSLGNRNFRIWSIGALVSNVGAWMQRIAQDWLVLTVLTHHDARAVGFVVALQFAPQMLLLPWTGYAADHMDRRKLLFVTQSAMGLLAFGLGALVLSGAARLWQVDVFAFLLGCAAAFDTPVRQTFVGEMVGEEDLGNAVALNSTSYHGSRLIGPAAAGLVIAAAGLGWAFVINGLSFVAVMASLALIRTQELHVRPRLASKAGALIDGLRYVWGRPDLRTLQAGILVFGALGLNFPVFVSTMAATTFHVGASGFGLLSSAMAVGAVSGALLAARRKGPSIEIISIGAVVFAIAYALAAVAPTYWLFGLALVVVGVASQTVTTSTTSLVQMSTEPHMRGRVMALLMAIALGGQVAGAPFVGWVANTYGPRWALAVGAAAGLITAGIGGVYLWSRPRASSPAGGGAVTK